MQINGSFPLPFLNNPQPGPSPDAGQERQAPGNGVQNTAVNPPTAVNPSAQAQPEAQASAAPQTRREAPPRTDAQARPPANTAAPSRNGANTSRLDLFA